MAESREGKFTNYNPSYRRNFRGQPSHSRIYSNLGVRDLRELLNRKRSEQANNTEGTVPPPDPSYNYLKDPLRENFDQSDHNQNNDRRRNFKIPQNHPKRERDDLSSSLSKNQYTNHRSRDIKNPLNIKVEFSTSTGEHVYKFDKETVLPTIKHVPDQTPYFQYNRRGRGRGNFRGNRSRGRGRFHQNQPFRTEQKVETSNTIEREEDNVIAGGEEDELWETEDDKNVNLEPETSGERDNIVEHENVPENQELCLEKEIENLKIAEDKPIDDNSTKEKEEKST